MNHPMGKPTIFEYEFLVTCCDFQRVGTGLLSIDLCIAQGSYAVAARSRCQHHASAAQNLVTTMVTNSGDKKGTKSDQTLHESHLFSWIIWIKEKKDPSNIPI